MSVSPKFTISVFYADGRENFTRDEATEKEKKWGETPNPNEQNEG